MKINEAIEELDNLERQPGIAGWLKSRDAIKLGIEALKWIEWRRKSYKSPPILPLPGETED